MQNSRGEIIAVIPARGGSKGVPGKNIRELAGKPLIVWSIEQALSVTPAIDVLVSTDCAKIADIAKHAGALVPFLRPESLATDEAATEPVMLHALEEMEKTGTRYRAVMLMQPTSPLRLPDTIPRAIKSFTRSDADSLVGVVENHAFFWRQGAPPSANYDWRSRPRRQDIAQADLNFRETGSLYITKRDILVNEKNRLGGKIQLFKMSDLEGWEIDTIADFYALEGLMKFRNSET